MKSKTELEDTVESTVLNFALVFRCSLEKFQQIKNFLLDKHAVLIYQKASPHRLLIKKDNGSENSARSDEV